MNFVKKAANILLPLLWRFFKWVIWIVVTIILFFLGVILVAEYKNFEYNKFRQIQPFDSLLWQKAPMEDRKEYVRCYMYRDLVKNHLRLNMTHEEVVTLLGKPSSTWVKYYANPELKTIVYSLGYCVRTSGEPWGIWGPDKNHLVLYFDQNLKLVAFSREDDMSEMDIQHDKNISIENIKYLFTCGHKDGECSREVKETNFIHYEYCKQEEVETKWGYKVW